MSTLATSSSLDEKPKNSLSKRWASPALTENLPVALLAPWRNPRLSTLAWASVLSDVSVVNSSIFGRRVPWHKLTTFSNACHAVSLGSKEEPHEVAWFNLRTGLKHVCTICGQVFQLKDDSEKHADKITQSA